MSWFHRVTVGGCLLLSVALVPILHCRKTEPRVFPSRRAFAVRDSPEPQPRDRQSWQAVPLAGRLVAQVPRNFDRWRWAAADGITLVAHSTAGRPDAVIYAEPVTGDPWSSVEIDRFLRTVAPQLASHALIRLVPSLPVPIAGLERSHGLRPAAAAEVVARLRSRSLGRGLGFRGRGAALRRLAVGWCWGGANHFGIRLRLASLEGVWGPQADPAPELVAALARLGESSPSLASLAADARRSPAESPAARPATLVLGSALQRPDFGVYLAIQYTAGSADTLTSELATFVETLRPATSGEMDHLLAARRPADLERLAHDLGWQLQIAPRRITDEDLMEMGVSMAAAEEGGE